MPELNPDEFLYHYSTEKVGDFTKAPTIHMGSREQAEERRAYLRGFHADRASRDIHEFAPSKHLQVHPEVLSDEVANVADYRFLKKSNYPVPSSIEHSLPKRMPYQDMRQAISAAKALGENKVVQYENEAEGGGISSIIPSPHFNIRPTGTRITNINMRVEGTEAVEDPHKQPVLPMDYSPMVKSERTKEHRRGRTQFDL